MASEKPRLRLVTSGEAYAEFGQDSGFFRVGDQLGLVLSYDEAMMLSDMFQMNEEQEFIETQNPFLAMLYEKFRNFISTVERREDDSE